MPLMVFGIVLSFCSRSTSPVSSSTQYQLGRSPRSKPIVSLWLSTFLIACAVAVLIFFIAGLLYLLRFERVDNLGAYSIPSDTGLLIPSDCAGEQTARNRPSCSGGNASKFSSPHTTNVDDHKRSYCTYFGLSKPQHGSPSGCGCAWLVVAPLLVMRRR